MKLTLPSEKIKPFEISFQPDREAPFVKGIHAVVRARCRADGSSIEINDGPADDQSNVGLNPHIIKSGYIDF